MKTYKFYDYIRTIKPTAIRFVKTISLFILATCVVATVIILAAPAVDNSVQAPANGGPSYEKNKIQTEQAKKNYILRRFISYYPARQAL